MKRNIIVQLLVFAFMSIISTQVFAEESPFSLSFSGQYIPIVSGDAGKGSGAPDYDDAFDDGLALAVEGAYQLNPKFALLGGISYENYSGDKHQGISFDDLDILTLYVGSKYYFLSRKKTGWNPYLRADIGVANFDSVDISYMGVKADYWDSSWELMVDAGAGVEYKFDRLGVFLEVKARYLDSPSSASDMKEFSKADSSWSLPIMLGVSFNF
ncbi:MAG: porin family protein [Deltaproteobacteria bacterium]|nr:porin family protein [Candidatus Tharpella aukensis]